MIVRWLLLLLWLALIFFVSHQPKGGLPQFGAWDLLLKKGSHFVGYGILAGLAYRALGNWWRALVLTAVYAITDEYHQTFIPGRMGTAVDVAIDTLGGLTSWGLARWWRSIYRGAPPESE